MSVSNSIARVTAMSTRSLSQLAWHHTLLISKNGRIPQQPSPIPMHHLPQRFSWKSLRQKHSKSKLSSFTMEEQSSSLDAKTTPVNSIPNSFHSYKNSLLAIRVNLILSATLRTPTKLHKNDKIYDLIKMKTN